jgi:hypothetical protein
MFLQVASHRRSGTHLLIDVIRANFPVHGTFKHLEEVEESDFETADLVLIKTHEPFRGQKQRHFRAIGHRKTALMQRAMAEAKLLYIYRNPYSVLESLYYFDLAGIEPVYRIPGETTFVEFLVQMGKQDATANENRIQHWCRHVSTWLGERDVHAVKYEDFMVEKTTTLATVARQIGLDMLPAPDSVTSSSIGFGTSKRLKNAEVWNDAAHAAFNAHVDRMLMTRLGYLLG